MEKSSKNLISLFGEKPFRGLPKPSPTPTRQESAEFTRGENAVAGRGCGIRTRIWDAEWCLQFKQSCPWATLSYFCQRNKAGKINAMGRVVLRKMFQKSSALSILFEMRSLLQIEFTTFAAKKPQPLCEIWIEKGIGEKGNL
jgi:hypothetical protein